MLISMCAYILGVHDERLRTPVAMLIKLDHADLEVAPHDIVQAFAAVTDADAASW